MKRQNNIHALIVGAALAGAAGLAQAQTPTIDRGIYVGLGLGQSTALEYDCQARAHCEDHATAVKYLLGWQFGRHWAVELGYTDLGKVSAEDPGTFRQDVKARLGEMTILGSYPASAHLMVYGKAGGYYAHTTADQTVSGTSARLSESGGGITWGFGLQYYVWRGLAARLEAQRYMKVGGGNIGDSDYNVYTLGLIYKIR